MSRSLAILFAGVTVFGTLILFFRSLNVREEVKSVFGKLLDKIPKSVMALVSIVCACFSLYYLTTEMIRKSPSLLGILYMIVLSLSAIADMYLSDVYESGRQ